MSFNFQNGLVLPNKIQFPTSTFKSIYPKCFICSNCFECLCLFSLESKWSSQEDSWSSNNHGSSRDRDRVKEEGEHDRDRKRKRRSRWGGDEKEKVFIPGLPTVLPNNLNPQQERAYLRKFSVVWSFIIALFTGIVLFYLGDPYSVQKFLFGINVWWNVVFCCFFLKRGGAKDYWKKNLIW